MKKYNICVKTAFAAFAVALSACSSDNDIVENNPTNPETPVANNTMTFTASMDAGNVTRTNFNSNYTIWAAGDKIKIVNTAGSSTADASGLLNNGVFNIIEHDGYTKEEVFTGTAIQSKGTSEDKFFALYPSSTSGTVMSDSTVRIKGTLPAVQTAKKDTYNQAYHFMTAFSKSSTFAFKNVCALLKITLSNSNISRIKVVANPTLTNIYDQKFNYNYISGGFSAIVSKTDGTTSNIAAHPDGGTRETYVELRAEGDAGTATTVIKDGTYYMVVLPASLPNGFTLLLEKSDGSVIYQRVATKLKSFDRNEMYDLGEYDCSSTPTSMTALTNVVDLDLPSGTLWATKNIDKNGAFVNEEKDYGDYFCWGYDNCDVTTSLSYGAPSTWDKTLYTDNDMAYSHDSRYSMPIFAQISEFYNHFPDEYKETEVEEHEETSWFSTKMVRDAAWAKFTAPTGTTRYIYLPYAGNYTAGVSQNKNTQGRYWSRTHPSDWGNGWGDAAGLFFKENSTYGVPILTTGGLGSSSDFQDDANAGCSIRPVATNIKIAPVKSK